MSPEFDFAYAFGDSNRQQLLAEAEAALAEPDSDTKDAYRGIPQKDEVYRRAGPADSKSSREFALQLLRDLNQTHAEFGAFPEIYALNDETFVKNHLPVPAHLKELGKHYRLYWVRFPLVLHALANIPFTKLECVVEFNPQESDEEARPLALQIFPNRKFKRLLEFRDSLSVGITENLDFAIDVGTINSAIGDAGVKEGAKIDGAWDGRMHLLVGPFTYELKKAQIEHSSVGSEKVFWRISGTEFFQEEDVPLIVILKIPKQIEHVEIGAALQAYHAPNFGAMEPEQVMGYFVDHVAAFLRGGAPIRNPVQGTKTWDISQHL